MRVKFHKGFQRKLILDHKLKKGLSWDQLALQLETTKGALLAWYHEQNLIPLTIYHKIDPSGLNNPHVVACLNDNWGKMKGGVASKGQIKKISRPPFSEKLAEFVGIILGDGNIHEYKGDGKVRSYMVRIAGDYTRDSLYLHHHVFSLSKELFSINPKMHSQKEKNELFVIIHSKEVVDFLKTVGLQSGNKLLYKKGLPDWILDNPAYTRACLRGLIDTDGSIYRMSRKDPHLLRIGFRNYNPCLLRSIRQAFLSIGLHPSEITPQNTIYLSRQEDIANYLKQVGFSNPKHKERLMLFSAP